MESTTIESGTALKRARQSARLTQAQLACLIHVSQPYLCILESRKRPVPGPIAQSVIMALAGIEVPLPIAESETALKDRRLARGWKQTHMAAMLGIHQSALSALESGNRTLTPRMRDRIDAVFAAAPIKPPVQPPAPTKQQRNREDYLAHQAERQAAARKRNREIRESWKTAIAAWDRLHEWTSPPPDWEATGASQHAVTACCTHPINLITQDAD